MTNENKQENVEQFLRIPKELLKAKHYLSLTTGEAVDLDLTAKSIYSWMKDRWTFFTKDNGQHYDSQSDVADALGIHRNTVGKIIARFLEHGIFVVEKRKNGRFENNVYVQIKPLTFVDVPRAPKKGSKSVSPITLYPCQGLDGIVETEALVERYSEPVEVIEKVFEDEKVIQEDDWELEWEEESDVVFINTTPIPVPPPTPTRDPSPAPAKDPSKVYAGDYFSDYPSKFFSNDRTLGIHHPEFMSWLNDKGGEIVDRFHFMLNGVEYYIPYHQSWKAV
ncbi:DUF6945 domain-containing protein [Pseudomonas oryzihabitans]|uniref:DUF6945 domain-containing protein n=1 Tax=Pseudomonas oryzihabitans TaxID=47885 RepID=UPI000A9D3537|nr:helix-turn-helix domain-containing protein [Pseudomonas psychrotolerans]